MTARSRRVPSEHQEQVKLVARVRLVYPDVLIFAIPNGGYRRLREAVRLKAEGVLAGIPDLFIAEPQGVYHGLFIEMKRSKGANTSAVQQKRLDELMARGYACIISKGAHYAMDAIDRYLDLKSGEMMLGHLGLG